MSGLFHALLAGAVPGTVSILIALWIRQRYRLHRENSTREDAEYANLIGFLKKWRGLYRHQPYRLVGLVHGNVVANGRPDEDYAAVYGRCKEAYPDSVPLVMAISTKDRERAQRLMEGEYGH